MKILHITPSYWPAVRYGGTIFSVDGLASAQAAAGHHVTVFTTNVDGPGVSDVPVDQPVMLDGVEVRYFETGMLRRLYRSPAMAAALKVETAGFDIVHLHAMFLWPTLAGARAAVRAAVPYLISPHGMMVRELFEAKSGLLKRAWVTAFDRRTLREAAVVLVTSTQEANDLKAMGLAARRVVEIPNGVNLEDVEEGAAVATDISAAIERGRYALFLGRVHWKKNLVALIEAMAAIRTLRLIIVGNDEEAHAPTLMRAIALHGLMTV